MLNDVDGSAQGGGRDGAVIGVIRDVRGAGWYAVDIPTTQEGGGYDYRKEAGYGPCPGIVVGLRKVGRESDDGGGRTGWE